MFDDNARHSRVDIILNGVNSRDTLAITKHTEAHAQKEFGPEVIVTGIPILSAISRFEVPAR
ncbi:MAG: hypothetical protein ACR2PG_21190 [Hyphomicrobiaceae bacterium]